MKNGLRLSTRGKHMEIIRNKHFKSRKTTSIFYIIDQKKRCKSCKSGLFAWRISWNYAFTPFNIFFWKGWSGGGELWSYVCVQSVYSYQIVESQVDVLYSPVFSFFSILQLLTKNQKQNFLIKTIFIL